MIKGGWKNPVVSCWSCCQHSARWENQAGTLHGREESKSFGLFLPEVSSAGVSIHSALCCLILRFVLCPSVCGLFLVLTLGTVSLWGLALYKWAGYLSLLLAKPGRNIVGVTASTSALLCTWKYSRTPENKIEQLACDALSNNPNDVLIYRCERELGGNRNPWQKLVFICPVLCYEKSSLAAKLDPIQGVLKWASSLLVLAEKTIEVLSVSAVQQEQRQIKIAFASSDSLSGVGQPCLTAITHKNTAGWITSEWLTSKIKEDPSGSQSTFFWGNWGGR